MGNFSGAPRKSVSKFLAWKGQDGKTRDGKEFSKELERVAHVEAAAESFFRVHWGILTVYHGKICPKLAFHA